VTIRAYLYDATAVDREVEPAAELIDGLHDKQLVWIDVSAPSDEELRQVAKLLSLTRDSVRHFQQREHRPRLYHYGKYAQLTVHEIHEHQGRYRQSEVDFILAANVVMTVHREPVSFLESFSSRVKTDSDLGTLDAPSFLAALLGWHLTGYFRLVEGLEKIVDDIDAHALKPRHTRNLLAEMTRLRQRVASVRRALTPHREVYAAMVRPDFQVIASSDSAAQFVVLNDRLDRAIEAVENARELLIGSFDIFTTQTTLRTNEAMKVLTLVSFIWFPASVIVGITAMLLPTPVHPLHTLGFWVMLGFIAGIGVMTLALARWRRWI
jgi:Mg2+ and Co2+ transporter CorA